MTLTPRQLEARTRTLGASEVPLVAGLSRWGSAIDVWARKRRGPSLELEPIEPPEDDVVDAIDARAVGNAVEGTIAALYARASGLSAEALRVSDTVQHTEHAWRSATPDRLVLSGGRDDYGLECKAVGARMAGDWDEQDGPPAYVVAQCQWSMHVLDLQRWDVAALVGGTDFRVLRLDRDDEMIAMLVELAEQFWHDHVLGDSPPPAVTGKDALRIMGQKWRQDDGQIAPAPSDAARVAAEISVLQAHAKRVERALDIRKALMCGWIGERKGVEGPWGHYNWPTVQGAPAWKAIAEQLAGGAVPEALVEKHRGAPYRRGQLYPDKRWTQALAHPEFGALAALLASTEEP